MALKFQSPTTWAELPGLGLQILERPRYIYGSKGCKGSFYIRHMVCPAGFLHERFPFSRPNKASQLTTRKQVPYELWVNS